MTPGMISRILALSEHYPPLNGGSATYTVNVARELSEHGCKVYLVTTSTSPEFPRNQWVAGPDGTMLWNVHIPALLGTNTRRSRWYLTLYARRHMKRWLDGIRPDAIHVLYGHSLPAVLRKVPRHIPRYWTIHNVVPKEYRPAENFPFPAFLAVGYLRLAAIVHARRIQQFPLSGIIVSSRRTAAAVETLGVSHERITVIPHGVHQHLFIPSGEEERMKLRHSLGFQTSPMILTVAGIGHTKGQHVMVSALSRLLPCFPHLTWVNVGDVRDARYEKNVLQDIHRRGLESHVRFLGLVSPGKILQYYKACDLYVQPSLEEGFCMSVLEALSSGCAVVATDTGAISEMIATAGGGSLVPAGNGDRIVSSLQTLLSQPWTETDRLRVHQSIAGVYSWKRVGETLLKLYASPGTL